MHTITTHSHDSISEKNINIQAPEAGEVLEYLSSSVSNVKFNFDISSATVEQSDMDFVLNIDGGTVVLRDFFKVGDEDLPTLTLENDLVIDAQDYFDSMGLEIVTAAGADPVSDGGGTNYGDEAGHLIDGVDRLGSLEGISDSQSLDGDESLYTSLDDLQFTRAGLDISTADPSSPSGPKDPDEETGPIYPPVPEIEHDPIDFDMRAVLYMTDEDSSDTLVLSIKDAFSNTGRWGGDDIEVKHAEDAPQYFTFDPDNPFDADGNLLLTLTDEGKVLLEKHGGASFYDYITVVINGEEHTLQVVANGNGQFDSSLDHASGNLDSGGLVHGEWHQGQAGIKDFENQDISTSDLADDLNFTGDIKNSNISTNDGDDKVLIDGSLSGSTLDLGEGDDLAHITGDLARSEIKLGDGNNTLTIDGSVSLGSTIFGAAGDVNANHIKVGGNLSGSIKLYSSYNIIDVDGTMLAGNGTSYIEADNLNLQIGAGMVASGSGQNIINTADTVPGTSGSISIKGTEFGMSASGKGALNKITTSFHDGRPQTGFEIDVKGSAKSLDEAGPASYGLKALDGGANTILLADTLASIKVENLYGSSYAILGDGGLNRIETNDALDIKVKSKFGAETFGISSRNTDLNGPANEFIADKGISININRADGWVQNETARSTIKGIEADHSVNRFETDGSIKIDITNYTSSKAFVHGVHAHNSGENYFSSDTEITIRNYSQEKTAGLNSEAYGVAAESGATNIFEQDLEIDMTSNSHSYAVSDGDPTVRAYGLYAEGGGENIVKGGLKVKVVAQGADTEAYGVLAENGGINRVGLSKDDRSDGEIDINSQGMLGHTNYSTIASSYGVAARDGGENLFYTSKDIKIHAGQPETGGNKSYDALAVYAKDGGYNHLYSDGGNIYITSKQHIYDSAYRASGATADGGINILETTSGTIKISVSDAQRGNALEAINQGKNILLTETGDITLSANSSNIDYEYGSTVYAEGEASVNYIGTVAHDAGGNPIDQGARAGMDGVTITISGPTSSAGWQQNALDAKDGGQNIIRTNAANDTVLINGNIKGSGTGRTLIDVGEGKNTVHITGTATNTDIIGGSGQNNFTIDGNITNSNIDAGVGEGYIKGGQYTNSELGSKYHIRVDSGEINLGMVKSGVDKTPGSLESGDIYTVIEADSGAITIKDQDGKYAALAAKSYNFGQNGELSVDAHNLVQTKSGEIKLIVDKGQQTVSMHATLNSTNTVLTESGDILLEAYTLDSGMGGGNMWVTNSHNYGETKAENVIRTDSGNVSLYSLCRQYGEAMKAEGGKNIIETATGDVIVSIVGTKGSAPTALLATKYGENKIETSEGDVSIIVDKSDYKISSGGKIETSTVHALLASGNATNTIKTISGDVIIQAGDVSRYGLDVKVDSKDFADKVGGESIFSGVGMRAYVSARDNDKYKPGDDAYEAADAQALNKISTESGNISINVGGMYSAEGMKASKGYNNQKLDNMATNIIETTTGSVTINALADHGYNNSRGIGMFAADGAKNIIRAKDFENNYNGIKVTITAKGNLFSHAMHAEPGGENYIIGSQGDDVFTLTGDMYATGEGSLNLIETHAGDDEVIIDGNVEALSAGATNIIDLGHGNNELHITGKMSVGQRGENYIKAGSGDDTVKIDGNIEVATFSGPGMASIALGDGNNTLSIGGYISIGRSANSLISTGSGEDIITIGAGYGTVAITNNGNLEINTGSGNDIINIEGSIEIGNRATQSFDLGSGDDELYINGDINLAGDSWGKGAFNIYAGEGNDLIVFNGKILGAGTLTVDGGSGYDTLVLQAANLDEFIERYGDWLMSNGVIKNIDEIKFDGLTEIEKMKLQSEGYLDNLDGIVLVANGGEVEELDIHDTDFSADSGVNYYGVVESSVKGLSSLILKDGDDELVFNKGVENSQIDMGDGHDKIFIHDSLIDSDIDMGGGDDHFFLNTSIENLAGSTVDGGQGIDILHIHKEGDFTTSELAEVFKGFETIDLSGGGGTVLNVDSLLNSAEKTFMVKGDEGHDRVVMSDQWTDTGTQEVHDNVSYGVFGHVDETGQTEYILIQMGLIG